MWIGARRRFLDAVAAEPVGFAESAQVDRNPKSDIILTFFDIRFYLK
jgi:hypothetical protein